MSLLLKYKIDIEIDVEPVKGLDFFTQVLQECMEATGKYICAKNHGAVMKYCVSLEGKDKALIKLESGQIVLPEEHLDKGE